MLAKKISREFYHLDSTDSAGIIPSERTSFRNNIPYLLTYSPITLMEHTFHGDSQDGDVL
jgi:hypothetical protein